MKLIPGVDRAITYIKSHPDKSILDITKAIKYSKGTAKLSSLLREHKNLRCQHNRWTYVEPVLVVGQTREFRPLDTRVIRPLVVREGALDYREIPSYLAGA